jgi:asparagine synthase (glutamine-hydrolysing)
VACVQLGRVPEMCGIAGIFHRDGQPVDRDGLLRMARAIAHRGPDGEGVYVDNGSPSGGLIARRLAIIDVAHGVQPMSTEDEAFTIVYNGEIYNAAEVRRDLEAHGHRFRSRCDTEVVLRGYAQWGSDVLSRLNGMWAFVVWDRRSRSLFLSRDRLGIKPLVYAETPQGFVFASEIKALLASGLVGRDLDLTALPHYLSSFVVPEPYSFFRGVRRLPAGCFVEVNAGGVRESRYWDCGFEEEDDRGSEHYRRTVHELLEDSVRCQLVSDVPLGVFLSSGLDSGLVAAIVSRVLKEPLRTFTLGFEGSSADERPGAGRMAMALGARHTEDLLTAQEAAARLPDLLAAHDEPSQSLIQGYFVSRLAKRDVTVALSGLGGDELFSSYPTHRAVDLLARLDRLPPALRGLAVRLGRVVGGGRGRRLAALAEMRPDDRVARWLMHQTDAPTRQAVISADVRGAVDLEAPARHLEEHYARTRAHHPLNRLLYVYLKTYLPDELLRALDSMSMAHSLEARVPLLDHRLVEHAMRMPARHKMSLNGGKVLLRRVATDIWPPGVGTYPKRGFSPPVGTWLRRGLTEMLRDTLCRPAIEGRGVFDSRTVGRLVESCLDGDTRSIQLVMMLFAFELWARRVLDAPAVTMEAQAPKLGDTRVDLSVIIVNWNTRDILRNCLTSVETHLSAVSHEIIVVDNASSDRSAEMVAKEFPLVRLVRNVENVGFARANNQAMRVMRGQWFLLLNSDTVLIDDSVGRLFVRVRNEPELGIAHCRLLMPDGQLQYSTYRFPSIRLAVLEDFGLYKLLSRARRGKVLSSGYWEQDEERDVDWVAGSFMLCPRRVFEETGGFSEAYFMYGEDMEWCYRIRDRGWRIRYYPDASVVHLDHSSSDIRWGGRPIATCIERQVNIYAGRHGPLRGALYGFVRVIGTLFRVAYFTVRDLAGGARRDYYRQMRRYYLLCLRAYVALAVGAR